MNYPTLAPRNASRQMTETFGGYNHNLRISDGEFYDMENLTSDFYPVLSPRGKRGVFAEPGNPTGLIAKDSICYVDGQYFVMNEYRVDMGLNDAPKKLCSMGAYVIIMPDKKWINTMDLTQFGSIEATFEAATDAQLTLCTMDGDDYSGTTVGADEPSEPANGALWLDTGNVPHSLKRYSESSSMWVTIGTTYVKISCTGIGKDFERYDGITISGIEGEDIQELNGSHVIIAKGDDYIVVVGLLDMTATEPFVKIERKMPDMDFIVESENRLWGCRYGLTDDNQVVNEIYASKLGDFKNWSCYMGLSTDSYTASCGTDGRFTGAITHLGHPLFFKEHFVHKVYGNYPANFQIQSTPLRGVQIGCEKSLAIVNEVLYYKSTAGICAFDGSLPVDASQQFGTEYYENAAAGAVGSKYYVSMQDRKGAYHLFVLDTAKGMWHKEDNPNITEFCSCRDDMYAISDGKIITMKGSGNPQEDTVNWSATTGEIGLSSPDHKYISRITIRMMLAIGAEVGIYAQYDFSDTWEILGSIQGTNLRSFSLPVRPKRCDHMRLKFVGHGDGKIYSITRTVEEGSELP